MSSLSLTSATIVPRTALSQHSSISSIINTNTNVQPANDNQLKRRRQDDESSQIDGEPFEIRVRMLEIAGSIARWLMRLP